MNTMQCIATNTTGVADVHRCLKISGHLLPHECSCGFAWGHALGESPVPAPALHPSDSRETLERAVLIEQAAKEPMIISRPDNTARDAALLNGLIQHCLRISWESSDDPVVSRHAQKSIRFRGPVVDALAVAIIAEQEGLRFDADVWCPNFLASRGLPHQGYLSEHSIDYAKSHAARSTPASTPSEEHKI